jgi:hypothetical protein
MAKVVEHLGTGSMCWYTCSMCNTKWITTKSLRCSCPNDGSRSYKLMGL